MSPSSLKLKWILIGLLLVSLVMPVMAVTGSFDSVGGLVSQSYTTAAGGGAVYNITGLYIKDIQNQTGLVSVYDVAPGYATLDSSSIGVNLYAGNSIIGTGTFGFCYSGVTALYTIYLVVDYINVGTMTGTHFINFTTPDNVLTWDLHNLSVKSVGLAYPGLNGVAFASLAQAPAEYQYMKYQSQEFHNTYTTSYASPVSTIGVTKTIGNQSYPSKVYIMQGTTVLASNITLTSDPFTTNIFGAPYFTINLTDMWGNQYVSQLIYGSGTAPTYSISVLPANITTTTTASGGITSTLDSLLNGITDISWKWSDSTGPHNFFDGGNTSRPMEYTLKSGAWYGYDSTLNTYSVNKGASIPNPVTLSGITSTGVKTIYCYIFTSDGNFYTLTDTLTVGGGEEYVTTTATMVDLSGNRINYGTISFQKVSLSPAGWTNQTPTNGEVSISSPPNRLYNIYGDATGYYSESLLGVPSGNNYNLFMVPRTNITAAGINTVLYVTVIDSDTLDIVSGASVTVSSVANQNYYQQGYTTNGGYATFYVQNNTEYFLSVSKTGYAGTNDWISIATEPIYMHQMILPKYVAPYVPPTAVPTIIGQPGVTVPPTRESVIADSWDIVVGHLEGLVTMGVWAIYFTLFWIMIAAMTGHIPGIGGKLFGGGGRKKNW